LNQMKAPDERKRAIERLHKKYAGVLFEHCFRMLGDRFEAEDAVQEAFLSAFRSYDSFRYGDSHLPWLYRIASNACLKAIRTRKRKGLVPIENPERTADHPRHPADELHSRRVLAQLVDQLDDRGLQILVGHYLSGMNQEEIALVLGISRRAVVKRLTRLKQRLGDLLEEV
jgi:RNA polymerase sigma-70 factor, ECF subfamily